VTPSEFKIRFPQFTSETDERVQLFITDAAPFFDVSRWGDFYAEGIANFVAHNLVVANSEEDAPTDEVDGGVATTETFGRISTTRSSTSADAVAKDPVLSTRYGRRYAYLRRLVGMGGIMVR
jgi:hypothetical protein